MLGVSQSSYFGWKGNPDSVRLTHDQFERLSYVFGVYKALQILFPTAGVADQWPNLANSATLFTGKRPIEVMASGHVGDLRRVRQFLDGECWG